LDNNIEHIDILIAKVALGEATAAEVAELTAWENLSDDNRLYVAQGKKVFDAIATVPVDADAAWNKLKQRMDSGEEPEADEEDEDEPAIVPLDPKRRFIYYYLVAASVVTILALTFVLRYLGGPGANVEFAMQAQGKPVEDTLPDGTIVLLNKNAQLAYVDNKKTGLREVKLSGEAFFNVVHNDEKPFVINVNDVFVKDVGTAFNVKEDKESNSLSVVVESGVVDFYTAANKGITLTQGQRAVYSYSTKTFTKTDVSVSPNEMAYKTRVFDFNNAPLANVIKQLNDVYGSQIVLESPALGNCPINVDFNNENLDTIVDIIAQTLNLTIKREGGKIILSGSGC
jgi:transmembrane sensor